MADREAEEARRRIVDLGGLDAYALLGVAPDAEHQEIVTAYRRAMVHAHPDRGGVAGRAQVVNCAYDVLTRHRGAYDRYRLPGSAWTSFATAGSAGDPDPDGPPDVEDLVDVDDLADLDDLDDLEDPIAPADRGDRGTPAPRATVFRRAIRAGWKALRPAGLFSGFAADGPGLSARSASDPVPRRPAWVGSGAPAALAVVVVLTLFALGWFGVDRFGSPGAAQQVQQWTTTTAAPAPAAVASSGGAGGGPTATSPTPEQASTAASATSAALTENGGELAAHGTHRCEVRGDGSLWCAGAGELGQLGNGIGSNSAVPVLVGQPGERWISVAVGQRTTCGLRSDLGLWCWGDNSAGQLGDGTTIARLVPVPIQPGNTWLAVGVNTHACGVRSDHTLWCWGADAEGQLGDGGGLPALAPQRVGAENGWAAVVVRDAATCGIRQNGTQSCWGRTSS